ncbi:MAG TPA: peptidoglycan DD-metalloendopeptidase family protein [Syntrophomonadaceae bacterium]|nr:peptidoglycan DD-metalloendopeptidase family protein [Syntrophomonadaceae bacterium]
MLHYLQENRRLGTAGIVLVFIFVFALVWCLAIRTPAYAVYVDGGKQFIIKNRAEYYQALAQMKTEQEQKMHRELNISNQVKLKLVFAKRRDITVSSNVENALKMAMHMKIMAAAIVVKGQSVAYVENQQIAQHLLDTLKQDFTKVDQGEKLVAVTYQEDVQIKDEEVGADQVISEKQAYDYITTGSQRPEKYTVKEGDSLWMIARRNNMLVKDITQANHMDGDRLKPGQELTLVKSKPFITVVAQVQGERDEQIPYEVKTVVDPNIGSGVRVSQDGQPGQKHVVYTLTKVNGSVDKKEVKDEKIIKAAVSKILVKGNQVQLASRGSGPISSTGDLDWPMSGSISQYFGRHTGLDICAPVGTTIRAADSGYVTFAGWQGGYGNFVAVDHGNGLVTRYAHCSSINVSVGQSVAKGEAIAAVGVTGHTTGPHLHFEVLSGGSFVNPLKYLN